MELSTIKMNQAAFDALTLTEDGGYDQTMCKLYRDGMWILIDKDSVGAAMIEVVTDDEARKFQAKNDRSQEVGDGKESFIAAAEASIASQSGFEKACAKAEAERNERRLQEFKKVMTDMKNPPPNQSSIPRYLTDNSARNKARKKKRQARKSKQRNRR